MKNNKLLRFLKDKQVFIKYIVVAGCSFLLDLILFTIFSNIFEPILKTISILVATIIARVISSFFNYIANRNAVFNKKDRKVMDITTLVKYYGLVVIQMLVSAGCVTLLFTITKWNETLIKLPVDIVIFAVNYIIQKKFIFNK